MHHITVEGTACVSSMIRIHADWKHLPHFPEVNLCTTLPGDHLFLTSVLSRRPVEGAIENLKEKKKQFTGCTHPQTLLLTQEASPFLWLRRDQELTPTRTGRSRLFQIERVKVVIKFLSPS